PEAVLGEAEPVRPAGSCGPNWGSMGRAFVRGANDGGTASPGCTATPEIPTPTAWIGPRRRRPNPKSPGGERVPRRRRTWRKGIGGLAAGCPPAELPPNWARPGAASPPFEEPAWGYGGASR